MKPLGRMDVLILLYPETETSRDKRISLFGTSTVDDINPAFPIIRTITEFA